MDDGGDEGMGESSRVGLDATQFNALETFESDLWGFDDALDQQSTLDQLLPASNLSTPIDGRAGGVPSHTHDPFPFDPDLFGTESPPLDLAGNPLAIPFGMGEDFTSPTLRHEFPGSSHHHAVNDLGTLSMAPGGLGIDDLPSQRTLPRRRSRYFRGSHCKGAKPVMIPHYPARDESALDPMQRWQDSPPEVEAASLSAIADALKNTLPSMTSSSAGSSRTRYRSGRRHGAYSTSGGTSVSSISTASSRSTTSNSNRTRGRVTKTTATKGRRGAASADKDRRPFQCTFCCDSFRTKYDWSRHETSLHLSLEKWVCSPHGGAVVSQVTGRKHCAYCNMLDPSPEHIETHGHSLCHAEDGSGAHVFSRKDHLVQHLRLVHRLKTLPLISDWKVEAPPMVSRCGFCDTMMNTWRQRADHLSAHFNEGKTMDDWRGSHEFEPAIEAQVMNALPPYTLGTERRSFVPFSATCSVSRDQIEQMKKFYRDRQFEEGAQEPPNLGNLQIDQQSPPQNDLDGDEEEGNTMMSHTSMIWLTRGMARFAQRHMRMGIVPTDAMFQAEARRLIYGSEDGWEQTIADNLEWLANFRAEVTRDTTLEVPGTTTPDDTQS